MIGYIAIAAAVAAVFWYYLIRPLSHWSRLGVKQSKPWVFFGDAWMTSFKQYSFNDFIDIIYNMHPGTRYSGIYNFNSPVLVLRDPEVIKQITVKDFDHFTDHMPFVDPEADPLWSNALLSLKGERWKEMRNTLSPTFTSAKIKSIYILMLETAESFVKHFLEKDDDIIEVEMKDAYSRFTNDVIATTAFGVKVNSLKDRENIFLIMGKRLTNFKGVVTLLKFLGHQVFPKLFKYLGIPFLDRQASKYFYSVMNETIRVREEQNIVRPDMIHLLLEARKEDKVQTNGYNDTGKSKAIKISNDEITSQAMIFFFAGFDTVSTAMCFASYELALNKEIQDRLREEINEVQKNGKVTYEELMGMKYMDMIVSETLRKWPPFPQLDRTCTKDYTIEPTNKDEKPVHVQAKQEIWLPIYGIQRDPQYFPDPEKFDPERFSEENKSNIVPYSYIPFGVGPRICIGNRFALLEIKALLFNMLINYEIVPTKKTPIPLVVSKDFSQMPEGGFWVGLRRISIN